ncbi:MAG: oligosaccharide flippase family protein [Phycisphaeraceae bacterium]
MMSRMRQAAKMLRIRPFDMTTEQGRSMERYRRIALSAAGSAGGKVVQMVVMLISVPLAVEYLGRERFGLWSTITTTVAMASFADLGVGNGMMTLLSHAQGREDRDASIRCISSAFFILCLIACVVLLLFGAAYSWIPWPEVFNVTGSVARREAGPATTALVIVFALNIALGVIGRIHQSLQEGYVNSFWGMLGSALGLVGLLAAIHGQLGLAWLIALVSGTTVLSTLFNGVVLWGWHHTWSRPRLSAFSWKTARRVMHVGGLFLVLQICGAVAYQADSMVIAQVLGAEYVTEYNIPYRLFMMAPTVLGFLIGPLWPAYAEALGRGDVAWIRRTLRRSLWLVLIASVPPSLLLMVFGRSILHLWVGDQVHPTWRLLVGMGLWAVLLGVSSALAMFLNAMNVVKLQVVCAVLMTICNITLSIILTHYIGVSGVVWGSVIAQTVTVLVPFAFVLPRLLHRIVPPHTPPGEPLQETIENVEP